MLFFLLVELSMLKLNKIHHVAIICSDYTVSKHFIVKYWELTY